MGQNGYLPVPVMAARQIAEQFSKRLVVIVAYDGEHNRLHTTTYGRDAAAKDIAANWGEKIAEGLGGAITETGYFEDFRATKAAELSARIDELEGQLARERARR